VDNPESVPLRFSLDCSSSCVPTVFSGLSVLVYPCGFLCVVLSCVPLQFSLDCPRVDNPEKIARAHKGGQSRENCKGTQERTTQRKPQGYTRTDNPEKTVGDFLWIVLPCVPSAVFSALSFLVCPYSFLWIVHPCVPLRFSLDCPPLCALCGLGTRGQTIQRKP
jgi:hypothetical protein